MDQHQRLRTHVLQEILQTEHSYRNLLMYIVQKILPKIDEWARLEISPVCTQGTVTTLFSNIAEIYELHVNLYASISKALKPYPSHTQCVGKIFFDFSPKFRAYSQYCRNCNLAQRKSFELEDDPIVPDYIQKWIEDTKTATRTFIRLEGIIISPIQRLCKYKLFLKDLLKYTPITHPDKHFLTEALQAIEDATSDVNETFMYLESVVRPSSPTESAYNACSRIGHIEQYGFLTKCDPTRRNWTIRWFVLTGYTINYFIEPDSKVSLGLIDLCKYESLQENPDGISRKFAFGITLPGRTYYMHAVTEEEKLRWLQLIKWKCRCIDRLRREHNGELPSNFYREKNHNPTSGSYRLPALLSVRRRTTNHLIHNAVSQIYTIKQEVNSEPDEPEEEETYL